MTEPGRDELIAKAWDAFYYKLTNIGTTDHYDAFKAGWDAALEQLARPDIIAVIAKWLAANGGEGYPEDAAECAAEVVRVLSDPQEQK